MAEHTTNLNLTLPTYLEDADIAVLNENFETIDTAVASKVSASSLAGVATSGLYDDLTGKPALSAVATSGSYTDLSDQPNLNAALKRGTALSATSSSHFSLHTLCTDTTHYGVGRYYAGTSIIPYIDDMPSEITRGIEITVEENQMENRFIITIAVNSITHAGVIYKTWLTSDGWSSWYKFTGTVVS